MTEVATLTQNIDTCLQTRRWLADAIVQLLKDNERVSEAQFASTLASLIRTNTSLRGEGWYAPPPAGIAALFGPSDNFDRLQFDTLRKKDYWPGTDHALGNDCVGIIYASPIDRASGIIGDFGMTIYRGDDPTVHAHLTNCLSTLEGAAELAQVGMEMRELHQMAQDLFSKHDLTNARTVTWADKTGTNLGHTIPWSYEPPTAEEALIICSGSQAEVNELISGKRVYVNRAEQFKIPETIAFTLEARLESITEVTLPNIFYHLIITFKHSVKSVHTNFNSVFANTGMDTYIKSRF
jgi:hypothetical protein